MSNEEQGDWAAQIAAKPWSQDDLAAEFRRIEGTGYTRGMEAADKQRPRPMVRQTRTYVTLDVPKVFHDMVRARLVAAGYEHAVDGDEIDMHGLALIPEEEPQVVDSGDSEDARMRKMAEDARENPKSFPQHPVGDMLADALVKERDALAVATKDGEGTWYMAERLASIEAELDRRSKEGVTGPLEKGLTAYRARFPDPKMATLWEQLPDYAREVWRRIEAACRAMVTAPQDRTGEVMGQAYQVVGALASEGNPEVKRALDYFAAGVFAEDFLPFDPDVKTAGRDLSYDEQRLVRVLRMHSSPSIGRGDIHGGDEAFTIYGQSLPFIVEGLLKTFGPPAGRYISIVCEGDDFESGLAFVEVENEDGRSINAGTWRKHKDGVHTELVIPMHPVAVNPAAPIPELEGTKPLVLYFRDDADRDEFIAVVQEAKPGMRTRNL